jgi:hypothetical protein
MKIVGGFNSPTEIINASFPILLRYGSEAMRVFVNSVTDLPLP